MPSRLLGVVVPVICSVVLAGCGSGGSGGNTGTSSSPTLAIKFVACMRSHGVPDFPDPGSGQSGRSLPDAGSPAFESAGKACAKVDGPQGHGIPALAATRRTMIANSQCMRTHGVPTFPDPIFPSTGGVEISLRGVDPQSPAFEAAAKACGSPFPGGARRHPVGPS